MDKKKLWTRTSLGLAGAAMALAVGVSLGNGAETMETKAAETPIYTLSPVKDGHNAYATAAEVAVDGVTWSAQGNLSIAPSWRIGGKSLTAVDRTIFSKTPLNHEMKKVDVHLGAMSSITLNSFTLEVASDAGFNTKIDTVTAASHAANSTVTFAPTSGMSWASGSYYKFIFNVTVSGSNSKYVEFKGADFYEAPKAGTLDSLKIALNAPDAPRYAGEKLNAADLAVTPVYSTGDGTPVTNGTGVYFDDQYSVQELTLAEGQKTYPVYFKDLEGKTATGEIAINALPARVLNGLTLGGQLKPQIGGHPWDAEGVIVTANWSSGDVDVTGDAQLTFDPATPTPETKEVKVTATFGGKTATKTYPVSVAAALVYEFGELSGGSGLSVGGINSTYKVQGFGDEKTVYGSTGNALRLSTGSAAGSFTYDISKINPSHYITGIEMMATGWDADEKTFTITPEGGVAQEVALNDSKPTFGKYEVTMNDADHVQRLTFSSSAGKRALISKITIYYAVLPSELAANVTKLDVRANQAGEVALEPKNFPSAPIYSAIVKSGNSLTADAVSFVENTMKIQAGAIEGETVFEVTATAGDRTAKIDIAVNVVPNRILQTLVITKPSTDTSFTVGSAFTATGLEVTATYDNQDTVVYSEANQNLGLLTFDPALDSVLSALGAQTVTISLEGKTATYSIDVIDHVYAEKIVNAADLWDGQQVYLGMDAENKDFVAQKYVNGDYIPVSQTAKFDSAKGYQTDSADGAIYTIVRKKIGAQVYYAFFDGDGYLQYPGSDNNLKSVPDMDDKCLWTVEPQMDGTCLITNKGVSSRFMRFNPSSPRLGAYLNGQADPSLYKVTAYDAEIVAKAFTDRYMAMNSTAEGQCVTLYGPAKEAYNALSDDEKLTFSINHEDAYNRLLAWATYHGDEFDDNLNLVGKARASFLPQFGSNASMTALVATLSLLVVAGVGGFLFYRKKKETR